MRSFSKDLLKSLIVHGAMVRGYNINLCITKHILAVFCFCRIRKLLPFHAKRKDVDDPALPSSLIGIFTIHHIDG